MTSGAAPASTVHCQVHAHCEGLQLLVIELPQEFEASIVNTQAGRKQVYQNMDMCVYIDTRMHTYFV